MRRWWLAALAVLVCLPAAWAFQDATKEKDKADKPAASPKEEFDKLSKGYDGALQSLIKDFRAAKDDDERKKIRDQFAEMQKVSARILELAEKNTKEPFTFDALLWVLQHGGDAQKVIGLLQKDHLNNAKIGSACETLAEAIPDADKFIRAVLEKNNDKTALGIATLSLAKNLRSQAENADQVKAKQFNEEADALFAKAVDKYADVKTSSSTVGQEAKNILSLALGKPIPEIQGEDLDGVKFKISDYRGKVVLLDFWGHW